jgi:hypothetical protein
LKEKREAMILFLVLDQSDDGFIQEGEWKELYNCIVQNKSEESKEPSKKQAKPEEPKIKKDDN